MNKRTVLRVIRTLAEEKDGEAASALEEAADLIDKMPEETAVYEKGYTQIHKGSPIAYPVWRCSNCGFEDRYRPGTYCKMCGRLFANEE